jgi:hypothetical protein
MNIHLRRDFIIRLYVINPAIIMATTPKLLADSGVMPNTPAKFVTKLFVSSATAISIIGRQTLYLLILATPPDKFHNLSNPNPKIAKLLDALYHE